MIIGVYKPHKYLPFNKFLLLNSFVKYKICLEILPDCDITSNCIYISDAKITYNLIIMFVLNRF